MPANLILLRHGQSAWNLENRFTGWVDVALTEKGESEGRRAGQVLREAGIAPDEAHTSVLRRAIRTLWLSLSELEREWIPVQRSWRLNERHYGGLQGLDKSETARIHGEDQVKIWRRSYDVPPPEMPSSDPGHPAQDERYQSLDARVLPSSESLATTLDRVLPYWHDAIAPSLRNGKTVLVAAHGNSLRALVKYLEGISDEEILELNIPTGVPRAYELDSGLNVESVEYLGDQAAIAAEAAAVAKQGSA